MTKHGLSHGTATLVTSVAAGLMVGELRRTLPPVAGMLDQVSRELLARVQLPSAFTVEVVTSLLVASALAVIWGAVFAVVGGYRTSAS
jgi:hypothetical protein